MIERDTIASEIAYCKELVQNLKSRNNVDSSRAILYVDEREIGEGAVTQSYTLAAGESKLTRLTYTHTGIETPYCKLQYSFSGIDSSINYIEYRDTANIDNKEITEWVLYLRNVGTTSDTFLAKYSVISTAPGLLSLVVL